MERHKSVHKFEVWWSTNNTPSVPFLFTVKGWISEEDATKLITKYLTKAGNPNVKIIRLERR